MILLRHPALILWRGRHARGGVIPAGNCGTILPAKEATPVFRPHLLAMLIACRFFRSDAAAAGEAGTIDVRSLLCLWQQGSVFSTTKLNRAGRDDEHHD